MGWIILTLCMMGICSVMFLGGIAMARYKDENAYGDTVDGQSTGIGLMIGSIVIFGFYFILSVLITSVHTVDAGHVGVVRTFGEITDQTGDGLVLTFPWQSLEEASVQIEKDELDNIASFSKETQDVFINTTVNYQVSPRAIQTLYTDVGSDYVEKLITPRLVNFIKEETVNYAAVDIAPNREVIRRNVQARLEKDLEPFSIDVVDLLLRNIDFNQPFKDAIEAKQVATQESQRQQELIKAREAEALQKIATANGTAEQLRIEAKGQADANALLAASLTDDLIRFQAMQKLADNIQIALIPSGEGIIIDPATILDDQTPE